MEAESDCNVCGLTLGLTCVQALGATTAVRLLMDAGAEINAKDSRMGRDALNYAAFTGQHETAITLVRA